MASVGLHGRFSVELPVGQYDIRLRAEGFVSVFFWDQTVTASRETALGNVRLVHGDSITGYLRTEDAAPLDSTAWVSLQPAGFTMPSDARRQLRLSALDLTKRPDGRGFFHFGGVAPGEYVIVASQRGYKDATITGVVVHAGFESKLVEDLNLTRPRRVRVRVSPNVSPEGDPWQVVLLRIDPGNVSEGGTGSTDKDGVASFGDLAAGQFLVNVEYGGRRWASREFSLTDSDQVVDVEAAVVRVLGRVLLGDDPLAHATLVFGGSHGLASVTLVSDASGSFAGSLPQVGDWPVQVSSDSPHVERSLRRVAVTPRPRRDYAEVEIRLPATRLRGRVLDEQRRPVPRAFVRALALSTEDDEVTTTADDAGAFELAGLQPGLLEAQAETRDARSDSMVVTVRADGETGPIELVLRPLKRISGRVLGPSGAVPGASVYLRPVGETFHAGDEVVTDAVGSFTMSLGRGVREVFARVMAAGYAFTTLRADVLEQQDLVLQVDRAWGSADVLYPTENSITVLAIHRGASTWLPPLLAWAGRFGAEGQTSTGHVVIPRLEAGIWSFCVLELGSSDWAAVWSWGQTLPKRCIEQSLGPGQRVAIDLRSSPPANGR